MRCVIFWCALNIPHAHGVSQTLFDTSMGVCVASNCCAAAFLGCLVVFLSFHATITCDVWYSTCDASSSGVHSTFHLRLVFPKHSVILLWFFPVLLIAALLLYLAFTMLFMRKSIITITCPSLELSRSQRPWRGMSRGFQIILLGMCSWFHGSMTTIWRLDHENDAREDPPCHILFVRVYIFPYLSKE